MRRLEARIEVEDVSFVRQPRSVLDGLTKRYQSLHDSSRWDWRGDVQLRNTATNGVP